MRLLICAPLFLAACIAGGDDAQTEAPIQIVGELRNPILDEASGLAQSGRDPAILWTINDDGPPVIYAIDKTGNERGHVRIADASNHDWEDIAAFTLGGTAYLIIADIGDNEGDRDWVTLYVIEEPRPEDAAVDIAWRIDYRYPDGRRDAESLAVDSANAHIYILSKRDIPAVLYQLPLMPDMRTPIMAARVANLDSLPQPSKKDVRNAAGSGWAWQPTAMDFSADGRSALILTYKGVYFYARRERETWADALRGRALELKLGKIRNAESIAFDAEGHAAFLTVEKKRAPLWRIDLSSVADAALESITIMTFNVENLFDNKDDPNKDDKAYLSVENKQSAAHIAECNTIEVASWRKDCLQLDWSDATIEHKLGVLAATIRQVNDGRGADVIALQEVENVDILNRLRVEYLADANYGPAILIEGNDSRGIDVAFLSRLPLIAAPILHPLMLDGFPDRAADTRGILQASFRLPDGATLTGFAVHFPAPYHPTAMRVAAYAHLNQLRRDLPADHHVFAAGDFNTTSTEDQREDLLGHFVRPVWTVAHELCVACPGTHYSSYDQTWSFLDMILFSPARGKKATWGIRADSVRIANQTEAQVQPPGIPLRYNAAARAGVSDHWPLVVNIEPTQKQ